MSQVRPVYRDPFRQTQTPLLQVSPLQQILHRPDSSRSLRGNFEKKSSWAKEVQSPLPFVWQNGSKSPSTPRTSSQHSKGSVCTESTSRENCWWEKSKPKVVRWGCKAGEKTCLSKLFSSLYENEMYIWNKRNVCLIIFVFHFQREQYINSQRLLNALGLAGSPNLKLPTEYVEAVDRFVRANTKKKRRHSSSSSSEGKKSYKKKSPSDKGKELSMRRRDNHSSDSEEGESTKSSQGGKKSESSSKASQGSREKSRKETKGSKDADSDSSSSVASVDSASDYSGVGQWNSTAFSNVNPFWESSSVSGTGWGSPGRCRNTGSGIFLSKIFFC